MIFQCNFQRQIAIVSGQAAGGLILTPCIFCPINLRLDTKFIIVCVPEADVKIYAASCDQLGLFILLNDANLAFRS